MLKRSLIWVLCLIAHPSFAQPDLVVVGTPEDEVDARDPTGATTYVRPADEARAIADLADVLQGTPGLIVRRTGGAGRSVGILLRGADAHQVAILLDDIPLSTGRGAAVDLSLIPIDFVESISILRGAAAATDGSGAQGGVIRLTTRTVGEQARTEARLRLGSAAYGALDLAHGQPIGRGDLLSIASLTMADGGTHFVDVRGDRRHRENADVQRFAGLLRGRYPVGHGQLNLQLDGVWQTRGEPGPEQFPRPDTRSQRQHLRGAASWARRWRTVRLDAQLYGRLGHDRFDDPNPVFQGDPTTFTMADNALGSRVSLRVKLGTHQVQLATDAQWAQAQTEDGTRPRNESRTTLALTLSDTWRPRADVVLVSVLRVDDTDRRDLIIVPKLGLTVGPYRRVSLFTNIGRAFRDPGFDELYFRAPGIAGNPALRSEEGWSADLGLRWAWARHHLLGAVFLSRHDRLIVFAPVDAYRIRARDDDGAQIWGIEAQLGTGIGPLALTMTYTLLNARSNHAPYDPLPFRPRHTVDTRLDWRIEQAVIHLRTETRTVAHADRLGQRTLPGYTRVDLGVLGPIMAGVDVGLTIQNALDARAVDATGAPRPGRTVLGTLRIH